MSGARRASSILADYLWLVSVDGRQWLNVAAVSGDPPLRLTNRLRKYLSAERARLVIEQIELRRKAAGKFSRADQMFFTPVGLEQATDEWVAAYKADRFNGLASPLADLCCGIGGDLLSLAALGPTTGVDRDPVAGLFAEANLAAVAGGAPIKSSRIQVCDVESFDLAEFSACHLDPDRRPGGRRTTRVAAHDPPPEIIDRLLTNCQNVAIKLAPAAALPEGWADRAELEWISRQRECRQLVAWFGGLADMIGKRRATILNAEGGRRRTLTGQPDVEIPIATRVGRYVFEPDPAVLAARLTGALAAVHRLSVISAKAAYLSGDDSLSDAALGCFEVLDLLPLRLATIKKWLVARAIGRVEVKKRGVDVDPNRLAGQLCGDGDNEATLLIAPIAGRPTVIAAKRLVSVR